MTDDEIIKALEEATTYYVAGEQVDKKEYEDSTMDKLRLAYELNQKGIPVEQEWFDKTLREGREELMTYLEAKIDEQR
jgi:enoyl reductase-like protein